MNVCLIYRKKNPIFFSIEKVFDLTIPFLKKTFQITQLVVPFYTSGLLSILRNVLFIKFKKADVFHITGDVHYLVLGLPRSKTILTIHDCVFLQNYTGIKLKILKWLLLDMPVKRASIITTISENSRKDILRHSKCNPDKIVVIPNPLNEKIYHTPKEFNEYEPVILFIGSTANKNLDRVITALTGINCRLEIVGKISDEQLGRIKETGLKHNLSYGLSEQELAAKYASADIILFPSLYEGFGLPIIEGQKAGRVVITSNISPMAEIAGKGAMLVDPFATDSIANAVKNVINDAGVREALIAEGFQNIKQFDASHIAQQYAQLYFRIKKK
jgi:glycosyltransferase involved in cell wall biosynthesis